ncbi:CinA family protein [Gracilinema caldarium]|uniref:CinA domain protein n=1 Tax=Gracilinema caldarium (strain ATCC 51460 / DSM 7334 / H1) TaxID=744872 RepID=F8F0P1_GRAC1|nr:CinA family protein [Gracilinema caldarium]AEJ19748.1 CinA domain protein [Gracilinema caldarium DSM 7334]
MTSTIAFKVFEALQNNKLTLVCVESCTVGLIAATLGAIPGISSVLWGSFVCYQNAAKQKMLNIDENAIKQFGPVSKPIAEAMAIGALQHSTADIALAITGIAGPESDETGIPVGTLWISVVKRGMEPVSTEYHVRGSRQRIRKQGTKKALEMILQILGS